MLSWIMNALGIRRKGNPIRRPGKVKRPVSLRLGLESLEDRLVPTAALVTPILSNALVTLDAGVTNTEQALLGALAPTANSVANAIPSPLAVNLPGLSTSLNDQLHLDTAIESYFGQLKMTLDNLTSNTAALTQNAVQAQLGAFGLTTTTSNLLELSQSVKTTVAAAQFGFDLGQSVSSLYPTVPTGSFTTTNSDGTQNPIPISLTVDMGVTPAGIFFVNNVALNFNFVVSGNLTPSDFQFANVVDVSLTGTGNLALNGSLTFNSHPDELNPSQTDTMLGATVGGTANLNLAFLGSISGLMSKIPWSATCTDSFNGSWTPYAQNNGQINFAVPSVNPIPPKDSDLLALAQEAASDMISAAQQFNFLQDLKPYIDEQIPGLSTSVGNLLGIDAALDSVNGLSSIDLSSLGNDYTDFVNDISAKYNIDMPLLPELDAFFSNGVLDHLIQYRPEVFLTQTSQAQIPLYSFGIGIVNGDLDINTKESTTLDLGLAFGVDLNGVYFRDGTPLSGQASASVGFQGSVSILGITAVSASGNLAGTIDASVTLTGGTDGKVPLEALLKAPSDYIGVHLNVQLSGSLSINSVFGSWSHNFNIGGPLIDYTRSAGGMPADNSSSGNPPLTIADSSRWTEVVAGTAQDGTQYLFAMDANGVVNQKSQVSNEAGTGGSSWTGWYAPGDNGDGNVQFQDKVGLTDLTVVFDQFTQTFQYFAIANGGVVMLRQTPVGAGLNTYWYSLGINATSLTAGPSTDILASGPGGTWLISNSSSSPLIHGVPVENWNGGKLSGEQMQAVSVANGAVYGLGLDQTIYRLSTNLTWIMINSGGTHGPSLQSFTAILDGGGQVEFFGIGNDNQVYNCYVTGGMASPWTCLGGDLQTMVVALDVNNQPEIHGEGSDGHLWINVQNGANQSWYGWQQAIKRRHTAIIGRIQLQRRRQHARAADVCRSCSR